VVEQESERVLELMESDQQWCASALCLAEARVTLCHLGFDGTTEQALIDELLEDWEEFNVVPVDDACLARAAEIGCDHRVRTLDAIHLSAAERLPRPVFFLTFDARQAAVARELGFGAD